MSSPMRIAVSGRPAGARFVNGLRRRSLLGVAWASHALAGLAQAQPAARSITLLVGYPPGGQADLIARSTQPGLAAALGVPIVVQNRTGAGGNIATCAATRAAPDGTTLLVGNGTLVTINPHTFPALGCDPLALVPIGMMLRSPLVLNLHASVPARTAAQFAAWVRAQPGSVAYGSVGAGSLSHVAMELFRARLGLPAMLHVPYAGSGPANLDLAAGRFAAIFDAVSPALAMVQAGLSRAVLVTGDVRSAVLPDAATAAEQGIADFVFENWIGLYAPPGTTPAAVGALNAALNTALADPTLVERLRARGDLAGGGTPEALAALTREDHARWGELVRSHGIRADQ